MTRDGGTGSAAGSRLVAPVAVAVAILLAVALTWPLAARLGTAGRVDSGDARHGIWNVAWVARALTSAPTSLFDANIFYPHDNALAFSEANIVAGVLAIPVWLLTGNGLAAANSAILLSFILSALAMFALARVLTGHLAASALAAVFFAYSPFAFARLAHMQLLMTFGLPLSLLALHRFVAGPSAGRAGRLGVAMAITALSCGYYGIFIGLAIGWGLIWFAIAGRQVRSVRYWGWSTLALIVAGALTVPFMLPYAQIRDEGFARTLGDARMYSADWRAYLASPKLLHAWMLPLLGQWKEVLFPGFIALGLASVTLARTVGRRGPDVVPGFYVSLGLLAAWASFGPDGGLYLALYHLLPFFELIRAPARFGVLVTVAVSVLAAFAVATLAPRFPPGRRRAAFLVLAGATLAASTVGPLDLADARPVHEAYRRLAQMPRGAVVEFPYFVHPPDRHRHTEYMFESQHHWQPLLNGYSDHTPPQASADADALARFPSDEAWATLRRRGARYVVVHWYDYPPAFRQVIFDNEVGVRLRVVTDAGDISLFEVLSGR